MGSEPVHILRRALERRRGLLAHHCNLFLRQRLAVKLEFCCDRQEKGETAVIPGDRFIRRRRVWRAFFRRCRARPKQATGTSTRTTVSAASKNRPLGRGL